MMGKKSRPWQDVEYVLGCFGSTEGRAKKEYLAFVESGVGQGRRKDLTGGGLIRSVGGWAEVKEMKREGQDHVMSDERILGDSEFVEDMLSTAEEAFERRYELKRRGYDADKIAERVGEIFDMDPREFLSRGRQQAKVRARSLFCFWAVKELGFSLRDLARRMELSSPAIGYCVERGEDIARENNFSLVE
jgi:hypothetical protein